MQCPQCLSHNSSSVAFCGQCGTRLDRPSGPSATSHGKRAPWIAIVLAVALGGGIWWSTQSRLDSNGDEPVTRAPRTVSTSPVDPSDADSELPVRRDPEPTPRSDRSDSDPAPTVESSTVEGSTRLDAGRVTAKDAWGRTLAVFPAVVTRNGWVAVPRRLVLGTQDWTLSVAGRTWRLDEGIGRATDDVGLWRAAAAGESAASSRAELAAWIESSAVVWRSITARVQRDLDPVGLGPDGDYLRFPLPLRISGGDGEPRDGGDWGAGVFVQGNSVVGWSFDPIVSDEGFLWRGEPGAELAATLTVEEFYELTFAGGREEAAAEALHLSDPFESARALIESWSIAPRLEPDDTPDHLRLEAVADELLDRLIALRDRGEEARIVELLPSATVGLLADERVLAVAVVAWGNAVGPQAAIDLAEKWWPSLVTAESEADRALAEVVPVYYDNWIYQTLSGGRVDPAWNIYTRARAAFPDDASIHLRGVELHLSDENWYDAERWIDARTYPPKFSDRVTVLRQRIRELKQLEGKIVIRFPPGSRQVQATALLNGRLEQRFIVDTGASVTTMPTATASALGIRITPQTPRVRVRTAGGEVLAADVTLDSVSLNGWSIPDVRVLVHDLPGSEELGLLGINFLRNFSVDLRTDDGILVLTPR